MQAMSSVSSSTTGNTQSASLSKRLDRIFERRDQDGSGGLSLAEFTAQLLPGAGQNAPAQNRPQLDRAQLFGEMDKDKDGQVTKDEMSSYAKERIEAARAAMLNMQEVFGGGRNRQNVERANTASHSTYGTRAAV
jgi:Ca2+-binding EF-hand superfamily protein